MQFLYFLPALGWGIMPVVATLTKSSPKNQLLGTATMALLFSSIFSLIVRPDWQIEGLIVGVLSGIFWAIGQYFQFQAFQWMVVSVAMPISNGTQLIATTAIAVLLFKEWHSQAMVLSGILALFLIIVGIFFTAYTEKKAENNNKKKAIGGLLCSSLALAVYVTLPKHFHLAGAGLILPQAFGMWSGALVIGLLNYRELKLKQVAVNLSTGLFWSIANISLFLSIPLIGVAKSFTLAQFAVLVSVMLSKWFLDSQKTRKEKHFTWSGLLLLSMGILLIGLLK